MLKFPNKFYWGTATAAFQIEGHPEEYLGKLSDWSKWIDREDKVLKPTNEGRAVEHYQHLLEDIELIRDMNNNAYRFSFNWARLHRGPGEFDENTAQFYKSLLENLLGYNSEEAKKSRIEPFATIVHFVLPEWLAKEGGWENPQTAYEFANFTEFLVKNFGQYIKFWLTHNEPNIFLGFGYESGIWPPGHVNSWDKYFKAYQGLLLGHQLAYQKIKEHRPDGQIGFAQNLYAYQTPDEAQKNPQRHLYEDKDAVPKVIRRQLHNNMFIESCLELGALDFLGINYYTRFTYSLNNQATDPINQKQASDFWGELQDLSKNPDLSSKTNSLGWEIYPEGLKSLLTDKKLKSLLGDLPVYITENGYSHIEDEPGSYAKDFEQAEGIDFTKDINDPYRMKFIRDHLIAVHQAINSGINVRGYFYWSLLDNFEWALGMKPRFGLVHVDHESFKRTPKASYNYYAEIAKANGLKLGNPTDNQDSQSYNNPMCAQD